MDMREALLQIHERAPSIAHEALKTLSAPEGTRQRRYNLVAKHALGDGQAGWTDEERAAILQLVQPGWDARRYGPPLQVRVSQRERETIEELADAAGLTLSAWVRKRALSKSD